MRDLDFYRVSLCILHLLWSFSESVHYNSWPGAGFWDEP